MYAYQDKKDDIKAGIKTITIAFGQHGKTALGVLASIVTVCLLSAGVVSGAGVLSFLVAGGGAFVLFARDLSRTDLSNARSCLRAVSLTSCRN